MQIGRRRELSHLDGITSEERRHADRGLSPGTGGAQSCDCADLSFGGTDTGAYLILPHADGISGEKRRQADGAIPPSQDVLTYVRVQISFLWN